MSDCCQVEQRRSWLDQAAFVGWGGAALEVWKQIHMVFLLGVRCQAQARVCLDQQNHPSQRLW